jgi:hypothetical protein
MQHKNNLQPSSFISRILIAVATVSTIAHLNSMAQDESTNTALVQYDVTLESLLSDIVDRDGAARWPQHEYKAKQASSYDRRQTDPNDRETWFANNDYWSSLGVRTTKRGKEWIIMEDSAPGCITRMWLPILPEDDGRLIRIYIDGSEDPVIETSYNKLISGEDFVKPPFAAFSADEKTSRKAKSLPPGTGLVGADLFLPIAYAKSCTIVLNEVPFYYLITYRSYDADTKVEPFSMDCFHAAKPTIAKIGKTLVSFGNVTSGNSSKATGRIRPSGHLKLSSSIEQGVIRSVELTLPPTLTKKELRSLVVKMTFDNQETVNCPVSEFFGAGVGVSPVQDWNRSVTADGLFKSTWIMPFQSQASVSVHNTGETSIPSELSIAVDAWTWDERSMHFHANWRISDPIEGDVPQDWNYISIEGQGVYVGDTLSVSNHQANWYGEGDERVYVDGELFPSQLGTGTEDYYGYAWGMGDEFSTAFIAMPRRDSLGREDWRGHTTTTRIRVLDNIPFRKSLKFDMEAWHKPEWVPMEYAAATFWYARPGATHNR